MRVLIAASEVAPIIKLGGLGDVIGSLPVALDEVGVNADVIVPFYPIAKVKDLKIYKSHDLEVPFAESTHTVEVHKTKIPNTNVDVFLLRNNEMFGSGGTNAFANDMSETQMFAFFDRAVVEFIKSGFNTYDLIHCNDWHTGLITHILDDELDTSRPATLLTVHNLSYQGKGDESIVQEMGFIPGDHPLIDWDISDGDISFLLQGITASDFVSTVSPSYAKEILTPELGGELSPILQDRQSRLFGIINGIGYEHFPRDYDSNDWKKSKLSAKKKLLKELKLEEDTSKPIFTFVSRLDPNQKGLDILLESVPEIVEKGGQFILLGTGDKEWEGKFKELTEDSNLKKNVSINIDFDVELAIRMYKGSDFKIIPSRFEPCGLTQMIAMWYGTLPIVHATGGLKDTVKEGKTGFLFEDYKAEELIKCIEKAFKIYGKKEYEDMVVVAMNEDFGWARSAKKYKELYEKVIQLREHSVEVTESLREEEY